MSGSKYFDRIAIIVTALVLVLTILFMNGATLGIKAIAHTMGYEDRLFDRTKVHTVDIVMNDWDELIAGAAGEEYDTADVVIDGESYKNVGIRAKGNTSLSTVASLGSERYSFKIEFDHYDSNVSYHGLDKLSLNNLIQDATMMKDYLTYTMMNEFGVRSSLCSYVYVTVNGEDWGLYLAVEGVEESFLERNYGSDYGELYKPDSSQGENDGSRFGGGFGMGSSDVKLQYIDDELDSYSNIWNNAKTDITKTDQNRLVESLKKLSGGEDIESVVDIEQVIRYFVVHNYVCNDDSYTGMMVHNYYLYEKDGQLAMIPWDYNLGFGTFSAGDATSTVNTPIDSPVSGGSSDRPMLNWIFENEEYTELYHQYFAELLNRVDIQGMIDNAYDLIQSYVEKDSTAFYTYEEFTLGVETLRQFCSLRSESISMQLENGETTENMGYADASSITLSDMGSMNGSRGDFGGDMPDRSDRTDGFGGDAPDRPERTDGFDGSGFNNGQRPQMPDDSGAGSEPPFQMNDAAASPPDVSDWIWISISAAILVIGLIVAKKYQ